jgi:hypothetical protein
MAFGSQNEKPSKLFYFMVFFFSFRTSSKLNIKLFRIFMRKIKINHVLSINPLF